MNGPCGKLARAQAAAAALPCALERGALLRGRGRHAAARSLASCAARRLARDKEEVRLGLRERVPEQGCFFTHRLLPLTFGEDTTYMNPLFPFLEVPTLQLLASYGGVFLEVYFAVVCFLQLNTGICSPNNVHGTFFSRDTSKCLCSR